MELAASPLVRGALQALGAVPPYLVTVGPGGLKRNGPIPIARTTSRGSRCTRHSPGTIDDRLRARHAAEGEGAAGGVSPLVDCLQRVVQPTPTPDYQAGAPPQSDQHPGEIAEGDRRHHAPDSGEACSDGATAFSLTPAFLSRLCQAGERIPGRHPEDAAAGKLRWRQGSWTTQVQ
jgi:hypothetical protein